MKTMVQRLPTDDGGRDDWITPTNLFWPLENEFRFTLDVCATDASARCRRYFTKEHDGLAQDWRGVCWMNPPYGRGIGRWVAKAAEACDRYGATVVALLPARTDVAWWHDHCVGREIRFIRGRVSFINAGDRLGVGHNAPFPSVLVVFRPPVVEPAGVQGALPLFGAAS